MLGRPPTISLEEARKYVVRAIDKAEELAASGAVIVVDESGQVVTASRMDDSGPLGVRSGRSKAYVAAATRMPSSAFLGAIQEVSPLLAAGYLAMAPKPVFPGAGAMLLQRDTAVIGAIATSGSRIGPFVKYPGLDPQKLLVAGGPANVEDLVISYARGLDHYEGQHGDDLPRWTKAYGTPPSATASVSAGLGESPSATRQPILFAARLLADRALSAARAAHFSAAVAVVDARGGAIQLDRSDGAWDIALDIAETCAATAAAFARPSDGVAQLLDASGRLSLSEATGRKFNTIAGGVPILHDGVIVGALGLSGSDPSECKRIAMSVVKESQ